VTPEEALERIERMWDGFEARLAWKELFGFEWSRREREQLRIFVLIWTLGVLRELGVIDGDEWDALTNRVGDRFKLMEGLEGFLRGDDE
jgi:hypothetical protein